MRSVHDQIREHLLAGTGLTDGPRERMPDMAELRRTEWSEKFERYMRNRLIMGAFRHGRMHARGKPGYDRVNSIRQRLDLYEADGNQEHLVDIANLCLLEFEEPGRPDAHWSAQDDGAHHTEETKP